MVRLLPRALIYGLLGAFTGAVCLVVGIARHPEFSLDMNRPLPAVASGFYPIEDSDPNFAWTTDRAQVRLAGIDRRVAWRCAVSFRGARPGDTPQPLVQIAIDGVTLAGAAATNDYQALDVTAPVGPARPELRLTVTSSTTFVPGPGDKRTLGVQVDRLACSPLGGVWVWPPRKAIVGAGLAIGIFGVFLGLAGMGAGTAAAAVVLLSAAQTFPFVAGPARYTDFAANAPWVAFWIVSPVVVGRLVLERWRQAPFHSLAGTALAISAGAVYLKLLALLHPSKDLVDAVFHAHRFESVLGGGYYFTQPLPDGVAFPYAIGLYLFAVPWSLLTRDHVELLRVVVTAAEGIAGALLYLMVVRAWADRPTGVLAVALFHVVPLPYVVVGNANLTNAFGQSAAFVALAAATLWQLGPWRFGQVTGLILLVALALLSHVSTFGLLLGILFPLAGFYWWRGGPSLRVPAWSVLLATTAAVGLSVMLYYGHFIDTYRTLESVGAPAGAAAEAAGAEQAAQSTPISRRAVTALSLGVKDIGWPILMLALVGLPQVRARRRPGNRLTLALTACGVAYLTFVLVGVLTPVNIRFERYADEFISRVHFAIYPAVVILAALGTTWMWRAHFLLRPVVIVLLGGSAYGGVDLWWRWFA